MKCALTAILAILSTTVLAAQSAPAPPNAPSAPNCPASSTKTDTRDKADKQPNDPACLTAAPLKPAADRFPYPGEVPAAGAPVPPASNAGDRFPYPGETPTPTPALPAANAAKSFPYPGESSSRSSSSSSSNSDADSSGGDTSSGATPPARSGRRILPKVKKLQSDEDRESEDLDIAKYYRQAGDFQAAYLRAKDAVKLEPGDSEAHFAVAATAERLGKKDEAVTEYTAYLKLDPEGDRVKSAKKALASLK